MAALSAARVQKRQNNPILVSMKMGASKTIYQGGLVCVVTATGLVEAASDTAAYPVVGVAMETKTSGATGTTLISIAVTGVFNFAYGAANATDALAAGVLVYVTDDQTVDIAGTTTNDMVAGRCVRVNSASNVDVLLLNTLLS